MPCSVLVLDIVMKRPSRRDIHVIVVSNKTDRKRKLLCTEDVQTWINHNMFDHVYTSAKTGENIDELFTKIKDAILVHQTDWMSPSLPALPIADTPKVAPGCSC